MLKCLLLIMIGCAAFVSISGQTSEHERKIEEQNQERSRRLRESTREKQIQDLRKLNHKVNLGRPPEKKMTLTEKEKKKIKAALAPNAEDTAKYKEFLDQPKTGLFRLTPNLRCSSQFVVRADKDCENSTYAGEYYSFRDNDYSGEAFFDVTLKEGNLAVGGFLSQGILVRLGDTALDKITLSSGGVKFLSDFVPQTDNNAAKRQFAEIARGVSAGEYKYSKSEKALLNQTYALRIVAYQIENKLRINLDEYEMTADKGNFYAMGDTDRVDLTLAFRIIRRDADGSISVLWKELNKKNAPKMIFKKNEPLADISNN